MVPGRIVPRAPSFRVDAGQVSSAADGEKGVAMAEQQPGVRKSVFISYAHQDRRWVDELTTHLRPWVKSQRISTWDDRSIPAGTDWRAEIERALADAAVSVVIVTPSAVASDFIVDQELPRIIEGASRGTTRLVWIAAEPAAVEATPLVAYQAAND